jgi:hypothetical protein
LDGRAVYGLSGAMSAVYDFYRDKALIRDLNVRLEVSERTGVREVAGVPVSLQEMWSSRWAQITPRVEVLKSEYVARHGRQPPTGLVAKMAQWATLETRPAKGEAETTEALFARWRAAALAAEDTDLAAVWAGATGRPSEGNSRDFTTGRVGRCSSRFCVAIRGQFGFESNLGVAPKSMRGTTSWSGSVMEE